MSTLRLPALALALALAVACDEAEEDPPCDAPCEAEYTCTQLSMGEPTGTSLDVSYEWVDGECRPIPGNLVYACDQTITHEGERRGAWSFVGEMSFEACIDDEFGGGCTRCQPK